MISMIKRDWKDMKYMWSLSGPTRDEYEIKELIFSLIIFISGYGIVVVLPGFWVLAGIPLIFIGFIHGMGSYSRTMCKLRTRRRAEVRQEIMKEINQ